MTNHITVARNLIIARWRESTVATAASVTAGIWASTDLAVGHVFDLDSIGAINKGRLPIARCLFNADVNEYLTDEGGMVSMSFDVEVIVGGVVNKTNSEKADAIMSAGEFAMRNNADEYWHVTDSSSNAYTKGVMKTTLTRTFTAELTWSVDSV